MAKYIRHALARGSKLVKELIYSPLEAIQTYLSGAGSVGVEQEQMQARYAPFRVNLSIPSTDWYSNPLGAPNSGGAPTIMVPFMLPPLQEDLSFTANASTGNIPQTSSQAPEVILDEFSLSFDTRAEPAGITSNWSTGPTSAGASADQGKLCYELLQKYNLTITILEKKPTWGQALPSNYQPTSIIWTGQVVADIELADGYLRTGNPFTVTDIRKAFDPYKTYILSISAPFMSVGFNAVAGPLFALVSVEASMKFLSPLRERDSGTSVQNIPTRHLGQRNKLNAWTSTGAGQHSSTARPLITATPSPGDDIEANTATGVQTSMAVIDEVFRSKLKGGLDMHSEVPIRESLKDSAAYTVLAVPLFNNTRYGGVALEHSAGAPVGYPYVTTAAGKFIDRRYIPITAPMTIHHVLFTWSWNPFLVPDGSGATYTVRDIPEGTAAGERLKLDIGVGMGTGARADAYGYEQIARRSLDFLSANPATGVPNWFSSPVDMVRYGDPALFPRIGSALNTHNLELHSMDLEGSGQPGLNGMTAQGHPIFVGQSRAGIGPTLDNQRTPMQSSGALSKAIGAEQFLEVRAQVYDHNGDWASGWKADQMIVGAGGIWVYIIGKTHLV